MNTQHDFGREPKVTIMIPTYNQEEYVGEAIESALTQSYDNLEVVISDDGSTDQTGEVARQYCSDPRVKYYKNEENLGRAGNYRKTLYDRASGDWVLNLDGDDYLTDHTYVEDAVAEVRSSEGKVVMVVGGQVKMHPDQSYTEHYPTEEKVEKKSGTDLFLEWFPGKMYVPHLATLYNRKIATHIGFYEWDGVASDWDSLRKLSLHGDVLLMKRIVGVWRVHGENATNDATCDVRLGNIKSVFRSFEYAKRMNVDLKSLKRWKNRYLFVEIKNSIMKILSSSHPTDTIYYIQEVKGLGKPFIVAILCVLLSPKSYVKILSHVVAGRESTKEAIEKCRRFIRKETA